MSEVCDILEPRPSRCDGPPGQHLQLAVLEEVVEPSPRKVITCDPVGRLGRGSQSALDPDEDLIVFRECTTRIGAARSSDENDSILPDSARSPGPAADLTDEP